jgi:2,4-dienoyl-CoA reductase-like NADH-dependent reductase (Old Yellow Enzyme family)
MRLRKEGDMYSHLFSKITVGGKELKNRLTMAPLYLGDEGEGKRDRSLRFGVR